MIYAKIQNPSPAISCDVLASNRHNRRITQEKMAELLYMTARSHGKLERGKSGCSAVTLILFLALLSDREMVRVVRDFARLLPELEKDEAD